MFLTLFQASRPTILPPNLRDTLYHGLPNNIKSVLYSRLQNDDVTKGVFPNSVFSRLLLERLEFNLVFEYADWKLIFCSSQLLRSKLAWIRLSCGLLQLLQIQPSKIILFFFAYASQVAGLICYLS